MWRTSSSPYVLLKCAPTSFAERSEEAIQLLLLAAMDCFRLRSSSYSGQVASLAMTIWAELSRALIERLAQRDIALLLLRPVAAAGDGAIDHQIMPIRRWRETPRHGRCLPAARRAGSAARSCRSRASHRGSSPRPRPTGRGPCRKC